MLGLERWIMDDCLDFEDISHPKLLLGPKMLCLGRDEAGVAVTSSLKESLLRSNC